MLKPNKQRQRKESLKSPSDKLFLLYNKACRLVSYRPRSQSELGFRLSLYARKLGIKHELIDEALSMLKDEGQVDDYKFAKWWIEQRSEFSPSGKRRLVSELKAKGVDESVIKGAIELLWTDQIDVFGVKKERLDDKLLALKATSKKIKQFKGEDKLGFRKKMVRYLQARGFDYDIVSEVTQELIDKYYD